MSPYKGGTWGGKMVADVLHLFWPTGHGFIVSMRCYDVFGMRILSTAVLVSSSVKIQLFQDLGPIGPLTLVPLIQTVTQTCRPGLPVAALQHRVVAPLPRSPLDALGRAQLGLPEDVLDGHAGIPHRSHQEPLEARTEITQTVC